MKLSVLIPVYNEEDGVAEIIRRVAAVPVEKEIIVVDDCSRDRTWDILRSLTIPELRLFCHEVNKGKGAAIRTALAEATGDAVIIQDADLEYDPQDYLKLLPPLIEGKAKVVYGARALAKQKPLLHYGNAFLTWMTNVLYGTRLTDMETCYKLIPGPVARSLRLRAQRFDFEPEVTAKLIRHGERILEVPITYRAREANQGKKISWKDGFPALWALLRYRFFD
jgi:glycosyltransferase involved in cell wall biosynthesis